jgi:uncharacterized membrane protein YhaH (DUF805 family)
VASLTNTEIEFGRTRHPMAQALCFIVAVVVILKAVMSRFHDIGWSGSAVLLMFVPLVDIVALFIIAGRTRAEKPNRYGEPSIFLQRFRGWLKQHVSKTDVKT